MTVREVVRVTGEDAAKYLQGQLSQDVAAMAVGDTRRSLLLEPDGKLLALLDVTRTDDGFTLATDAGRGEAVLTRLRRFLLRTKATVEAGADLPVADDERSRIRAGVPVVGVDLEPGEIPAVAGQWLIDASVSFTKGCYVGQELVARVDSRGGNAPRRLVAIEGRDLVVGSRVVLDGKDVGAVTSSVGDVALAVVARSVEDGAAVDAGGPAVVRPLPLDA